MNTIKIPLMKIKRPYDAVGYELPSGVVLGHDGENLVTELQLIMPEIIDKAKYWIEFNNGQAMDLTVKDNCLCGIVKAEYLSVGDIDVQLCWSYLEVIDNKEEAPEGKSNIAKWRVLDSIELSRELEKAYPDILATLMANLSKTGIEMRYNEATRFVEWSYMGEEIDTWYQLFSADDVTEGASAYQVAVKNGFKGSEAEWLESLHGKDGKDGENGKDGVDGRDGQNGLDGKDGKDGTNGIDGKNGEDGFSPEITAEETETGVSFTITRKDAEAQTVVVYNGKNGADGKDGINGKDGTNGIDGKDGQNGQDGKDGENYVITDADYQAIANIVMTQFVDGDNLTY